MEEKLKDYEKQIREYDNVLLNADAVVQMYEIKLSAMQKEQSFLLNMLNKSRNAHEKTRSGQQGMMGRLNVKTTSTANPLYGKPNLKNRNNVKSVVSANRNKKMRVENL